MSTQTIISIIIIAIVVIALALYLTYQIKKKGLRKVAIEFIVMAEEKFKQGQNSEKFNYVFEAVYELLPAMVKIFITKTVIIKFIQKVFDEVKIALDYQGV